MGELTYPRVFFEVRIFSSFFGVLPPPSTYANSCGEDGCTQQRYRDVRKRRVYRTRCHGHSVQPLQATYSGQVLPVLRVPTGVRRRKKGRRVVPAFVLGLFEQGPEENQSKRSPETQLRTLWGLVVKKLNSCSSSQIQQARRPAVVPNTARQFCDNGLDQIEC
jgi:hypothetical protein